MPPKGKRLTAIDLAVIETLRMRAKDRALGTRALSRESGIGLNRTGIILRADGPSPTIGELDQLASALGTTASEILRTAERAAHLKAVPDLPAEVYGTPPAYDPELMAAQGKGTNIDAEQEGSQDLP